MRHRFTDNHGRARLCRAATRFLGKKSRLDRVSPYRWEQSARSSAFRRSPRLKPELQTAIPNRVSARSQNNTKMHNTVVLESRPAYLGSVPCAEDRPASSWGSLKATYSQKRTLTTGLGFDKKTAFSKRLDSGRGFDRTRRVSEREPDLLGDMNSKCRMLKCGPDLMMGVALHEAGNKGRKMKYVTFRFC